MLKKLWNFIIMYYVFIYAIFLDDIWAKLIFSLSAFAIQTIKISGEHKNIQTHFK